MPTSSTSSGSSSGPSSGPSSGSRPPSAPALVRPTGRRRVAGVAAGIADHFGVDPTIVRAAFVVLAVLGGGGIALYLLGWLLIPDEEEGESLATQLLHHRPGERWPVGAVVIAALVLLTVAGAVNHPFHMGFVVPLALIAAGAVFLSRHGGTSGPPPATPATGSPSSPWPPPAPPAPPSAPPAPPAAPAAPADEGADEHGREPGGEHRDEHDSDYDPILSDPIVTDPLGLRWAGFSTDAPTSSAAVTAPAPAVPTGRRVTAATVSAIVALGGAVLLADAAHLAHVGLHGFAAVALIVTGAGLALSAWGGRVSGGRAWGLIPVAVALTALLAVSGSWHVRGPIGTRHFRPASAAELHRSYRVAVGDLDLDLRDIRVADGDVHVSAEVGAGHLVVTVPPETRVHVDARSGVGHVALFDRGDSGTDVRLQATDGPPGASGGIILDLRAGAGEVEVDRAA